MGATKYFNNDNEFLSNVTLLLHLTTYKNIIFTYLVKSTFECLLETANMKISCNLFLHSGYFSYYHKPYLIA